MNPYFVPGTWYLVLCTILLLDTGYLPQCLRVHCTWYLVLSTLYLVHLLEFVVEALQDSIPLSSTLLITSKELVT